MVPPVLDYGDDDGSPTQEDPAYQLYDEESFSIRERMQGNVPSGIKPSAILAGNKLRKVAQELRLSKHGIPVPSLPPRLVKKLASNFAGGKSISNETLAHIMKATDAFFEDASTTLGNYAEHAGRKTIVDADVELLLKRCVYIFWLPLMLLSLWDAGLLHLAMHICG